MWFKNIYILQFEKPLNLLEHGTYHDAEALHEALSKKPFTDCTATQRESMGFVTPLGKNAESFTHKSGNFILLTMARQERMLPASVIREELQERVEAIQDAESRKVGSKEKKELTTRIEDELLPRAFTRTTKLDAYLDIKAGLLVINTPSAAKAETFATLLRKTIGSLPAVALKTEFAGANLTRWLSSYQVPENFVIGDECELKSCGDDSGTATFRKHELGTDEVKSNIEAGKTVAKLSLYWDKKISFVVDHNLIIKKLKFLDVLEEKMNEEDPQTHEERLDIEFTLMTGELSEMLQGLLKAMDVTDTDVGDMNAKKEVVFIDGVKESGECPRSEDGMTCPVCSKRLDGGYGFAAGYGLGMYNYCEDHGYFDFLEDIDS